MVHIIKQILNLVRLYSADKQSIFREGDHDLYCDLHINSANEYIESYVFYRGQDSFMNSLNISLDLSNPVYTPSKWSSDQFGFFSMTILSRSWQKLSCNLDSRPSLRGRWVHPQPWYSCSCFLAPRRHHPSKLNVMCNVTHNVDKLTPPIKKPFEI
jgi:hypothetical protein